MINNKNISIYMLLMFTFLFVNITKAQYTLTPSKVCVNYQGFNELSYDSIHIANNSIDTLFLKFQYISNDTSGGTYFDLCTSGECWLGIPAGGNFPPIVPGGFGWAGVHLWTGNVAATSTAKIWLYKQGNISTGDTLTYILHAVNLNAITENTAFDTYFEVYPIPAKDKITIKNNMNTSNENTFTLYNIIGEKVYSTSSKNILTEIPLEKIREGIYFLNIFSENKMYTKKILVRK